MSNFLYKRLADNKQSASLASKARTARFELFKKMIATLPKPIHILDVGGTQTFWQGMNFLPKKEECTITLLNLKPVQTTFPGFSSIQGDATDLKSIFGNGQFDVVFSNSVIEHLYTWENQKKMAAEIRRVGKKYFIQTPNYWFPIEPHFVFPLFQYLPKKIRILLTERYTLGHYPKAKTREAAVMRMEEIRLLTISKMKKLFPDGEIYREKFLGFTKSIIAHNFT